MKKDITTIIPSLFAFAASEGETKEFQAIHYTDGKVFAARSNGMIRLPIPDGPDTETPVILSREQGEGAESISIESDGFHHGDTVTDDQGPEVNWNAAFPDRENAKATLTIPARLLKSAIAAMDDDGEILLSLIEHGGSTVAHLENPGDKTSAVAAILVQHQDGPPEISGKVAPPFQGSQSKPEPKARKPRENKSKARKPREATPKAPATPQRRTVPEGKDLLIVHNTERDGIEITFAEKPDDEIREKLRTQGFRWSGRQGIWWARHSEEKWEFANSLESVKI